MYETALESRVYNAIPVTQQAFCKLLNLLSVEESREIETACVTLGQRSRLLLNPDFVTKYCTSEERLGILILHELYHVLLGHTRLFTRITPAQNVAFDAVINASLCALFPAPVYTVFFRSIYKPDQLPEALLRPPDGWRTPEVHWALEGAALRVHQALYHDDTATYHELFQLLEREFPGMTVDIWPQLLGNHGEEGEPNPLLVQEVREIIAKWPMVIPVSGRDLGGPNVLQNLRPREPKRVVVETFRAAIWNLVSEALGYRGLPRPDVGLQEGSLPYQTVSDRRASVGQLLGQAPFFYRAELLGRTYRQHERAHVYLDVSGSMTEFVPMVYGALFPLSSLVHPKVHLFSTKVADASLSDLRKGYVCSDLGTHINCVMEHILENRVCKALLITDGWVGEVSEYHATKLKQRGVILNTVLTQVGDPGFMKNLSGRLYQLNVSLDAA
jgi:hypothetical protein